MRFRDQIADNIHQALQRRDLLQQMVVSKLIVGQKDFLLGYLWWVIEPILSTIIYWLLFHVIFERGGPDYHIFILCGLIAFKPVSSSFNQSLIALSGSLSLLSQLSFPRIFLPISNVLVNHVKLIFGFLVLFIVASIYYRSVPLTVIWVIVPFTLQVVLLCGIAMYFSVMGVYFADLRNIVELVIRALLFLSPIFFGLDRVPLQHQTTYLVINPLAPLILSYRDIFLKGEVPRIDYLLILLIQSVIIFVVGYLFFQKHERRILKCL